MASVTVQAADVDEVGIAIMGVFTKAGFSAREVKRGSMNFERVGSTWDTVLYGSLRPGDVYERVKLRVIPLAINLFRLDADTYKVSNPGDQVFEQERRVPSKGKLDKLLNEVQAQLKKTAPAGSPVR